MEVLCIIYAPLVVQKKIYIDLPNGSVYYGQFSPLGMEGKCVYGIAHGPVFHGSMVGGKMEGPGKLFYSNG
ncbi:unnamed protein product, partial [Nesidiocoris tenuis]